jgi:inorganic triphosphatase YgiF
MAVMSSETELKLRIPAARLAAVRRAVATHSAQVLPLAAVYFDTPGEHLARARVALRLRREGAHWVQTLKAEGGNALHRLEHNVTVTGAAGAGRPALDLARHDGTAAGLALRAVLADLGDVPLQVRYATEVQRTQRVLRAGGTRIELALDEGRITAGTRQLPICEIEFELLAGTPQALLDVVGRWVDRFGLVLDLRSKSERGHHLAAGVLAGPPGKARPLRLPVASTPAQALAAMQAHALGPVLANASVMADADLAGLVAADAEYLHQLRVGLRRLRSLLRVYGKLAPPAAVPASTPAPDPAADGNLAPALGRLFGQLGAARDQDAMAEWLWPALRAAGAPWVPDAAICTAARTAARTAADTAPAGGPPAGEAVDIGALLRAPATQRLWLSALAACQPPPAPDLVATTAAADKELRAVLRPPLQRLLRQVRRDAARFDQLDDAGRHRLRRRIKRLRYAADAAVSLWPAKAGERTLRALAQAQEPLGAYNDTVVALALMHRLAAQDARAWFAVGWLTARRDALAAPCAQALQPLSRLRGFWQRR